MITHTHNMLATPIIATAIQTLERLLPPKLYYHSVEHTKSVLDCAITFATEEGKSAKEIELISIAAAYHDTGFITQYHDNERFGADMATGAMQSCGLYSDQEKIEVENMILSTQVFFTNTGFERNVKTKLAYCLLDADLSVFGSLDFMHQCELLRKERVQEEVSFYKETVLMMKDHFWFTQTAKLLLQNNKSENLAKVQDFVDTH